MLRLIHIPMPAPMIREMTLVMRKVNTTLVVESPFSLAPPLPLPGGGDRALGGDAALELPLLGRQDVGSGAPVPDEVRHLLPGQPRLPKSVDVDATTRVSHRGALCEILKEII